MHTHIRGLRGPLAASLLALVVASPALAQSTGDDGQSDQAQTDQTQTDQAQSDPSQSGQGGTDGAQSGESQSDAGGSGQTPMDQAQTSSGADSGTATGAQAEGGSGSTGGDMAQGGGSSGTDQAQSSGGSGSSGQASGQSGSGATTGAEVERAIEQADAPTTGVTDTQGGATDQATVGTQPAPSGGMADTMPQAADNMDAMTEPGPGQAPSAGGQAATDEQMGQTVMLDVERFSQEVYERGFRQGYIRGVQEARAQIMEQMQRVRQGQGQMGEGGGQERGAVVVLPRGVSPEAFLQRLQQGQ